jgi:hypothetical protein
LIGLASYFSVAHPANKKQGSRPQAIDKVRIFGVVGMWILGQKAQK